MKSAILVFPGINRERDMARALKLASGHEAQMVWHAETSLPAGTDLVVVPGGFSYGDYLRCGAIAARSPVMDAVRAFAGHGGLVLGVCNGFQILCESGLLPGVLMRNARLKFICHDVHLRVERSDTPFTRGYNAGQVIRVPIAHGEGNYEADEETLKRIEGDGRVLYRYCSADGAVDEPSNINGAAHSIAGIVNERGNVLGMMPHPENHVEDIMGCTDGRGLFAGLVAHLEKAAWISLPYGWPQRLATLPDLPISVEVGLAEFESQGGNGLFAPKGTPPEIIAKLNEAARTAAVASETLKKRFADLSTVAPDASEHALEVLQQLVTRDVAKYHKLLQ